MSGLHKQTAKFDPLGHEIAESILEIDKTEKEAANAEALAKQQAADRDAADARAADALKVRQVETRGRGIRQQAAAAGVTRSSNEQDYLVNARAPTKRKNASRVLLGE